MKTKDRVTANVFEERVIKVSQVMEPESFAVLVKSTAAHTLKFFDLHNIKHQFIHVMQNISRLIEAFPFFLFTLFFKESYKQTGGRSFRGRYRGRSRGRSRGSYPHPRSHLNDDEDIDMDGGSQKSFSRL